MDSRWDESIQFLAGLYSVVAVKLSNSLPIPPSVQSGLQSDRNVLASQMYIWSLTAKERDLMSFMRKIKIKIMITNLCFSGPGQVYADI